MLFYLYDAINDENEHFSIVKVSEKSKKRLKVGFRGFLVLPPFSDVECIFGVRECARYGTA